MRGISSQFDMACVTTLEQAIACMSRDGAKPFAGGTDLMVQFDAGLLPPGKYVNLWNLSELRAIDVTDDKVILGALTTYSEIRSHPVLVSEFPILVQAASETGGVAIQNRGTIGGNVANASPAADSPPGLLVYHATLVLQGPDGQRRVAYDQFHAGYKKMDLRPHELITAIELPRRKNEQHVHYFRKIGTRKAQAISKVVVAGLAIVCDHKPVTILLAMGSVGPTVMRLPSIEALILTGAAEKEIRDEMAQAIKPLDDIRSTRDYRLAVSSNAAIEFMAKIQEHC